MCDASDAVARVDRRQLAADRGATGLPHVLRCAVRRGGADVTAPIQRRRLTSRQHAGGVLAGLRTRPTSEAGRHPTSWAAGRRADERPPPGKLGTCQLALHVWRPAGLIRVVMNRPSIVVISGFPVYCPE